MTTTPSPEADARAMLHNNLLEHLEEAENLGNQYQVWSADDVESVRKIVPDLVMIIRTVLAAHDDEEAKTCRACAQPWPCAELRTLHRMIKDPAREFYPLLRRVHDSDGDEPVFQ